MCIFLKSGHHMGFHQDHIWLSPCFHRALIGFHQAFIGLSSGRLSVLFLGLEVLGGERAPFHWKLTAARGQNICTPRVRGLLGGRVGVFLDSGGSSGSACAYSSSLKARLGRLLRSPMHVGAEQERQQGSSYSIMLLDHVA